MSAQSNPNTSRGALWRLAGVGFIAVALSLSAAGQEAPTPPANTNTNTDQTQAQAPAKATTAPADQVVKMEEYHVTAGFAGSLAAAAEVKEALPTITEVIASEDIGKLPDVSIADSLTRLTGIAAQTINGRNQSISIRGLTSDFSTGLLNGREQASTAENRGVEFDQYPAELVNEVIVHKTASANLIAQGLAGTVDMQTVRPLDRTGRTIAASAYYDWTQYGQLTPGPKKTGERFNVAYIDQMDGGKVGIAVGFAHTSTPWEGKQFQA
ncbi:MAG TPA: TonB-dependent receptor plug domain-containing protein, partial [Opitutaceae bacterium]|nr:TonB-dependent receptor plug domain-containing protein [Opitutaceae bacterium]